MKQPIKKNKLDKELIDNILTNNYPSELSLDNNLNILQCDNIQVDRDEDVNDFFVSWKKFKHRPSKIVILSQFESSLLWDIIINDFDIDEGDINKIVEIFPDNSGIIYNKKYFISISDDISISFFEFDREDDDEELEEIYSSNLIIYYNQKTVSPEEIGDVLSAFQTTMIDLSHDEEDYQHKSTVNSLHIGENNQFELRPIQLNEPILKKYIKFYYNKNTIDSGKKSIELINSNDNGLTILCGDRGNGKTSFVNYMINNINKKIIYVPVILIENTLNNIDFIDFIKLNQNSVFVFDDCENFFEFKNQKNNLFSTSLLQILDGISSDVFTTNFLLIMNCENKDIDTNILESNKFLSNISFYPLEKTIASKLSKKLGKNIKYDNKVKLRDVIKGNNNKTSSTYY